MPDSLKVALTSTQLRRVILAVGEVLGDNALITTVMPRDEEDLVAAYLSLVRAHQVEGGWRPQGITLSHWAIAALARVLTPPPPPKHAAAKKPAAPKPPKRRRSDTRRRHDRPRTATTETGPPLPMSDDPDADISGEVLQ